MKSDKNKQNIREQKNKKFYQQTYKYCTQSEHFEK